MRRYLKTEAIILKKNHLLNKDKVVGLFTERFGKLSLIAKGVKKITSRRLPHLETGNLIEAEIYKKGECFYLQGTSLISGFYKIRQKEDKYPYLYQGLFILDRLLPENQREKEVYNLTKRFLVDLSEKDKMRSGLQVFLREVFYLLGYIKSFQPEEDINSIFHKIVGNPLERLI